jgi:hypothetical protein
MIHADPYFETGPLLPYGRPPLEIEADPIDKQQRDSDLK